MTNARIQILEAAKYHKDKSFRWYEKWEEAVDQDIVDICWEHSIKQEYMTRGLVEAYNILTDRDISTHQIEEELEHLA